MSDNLVHVEPDLGTRIANHLAEKHGDRLEIIPDCTDSSTNPTGPLGTWYTWEIDGRPAYMLDYFAGANNETAHEGGTHYAHPDLIDEVTADDEPAEAPAVRA